MDEFFYRVGQYWPVALTLGVFNGGIAYMTWQWINYRRERERQRRPQTR